MIMLIHLEAERKKWEMKIEPKQQYKNKYRKSVMSMISYMRIYMEFEKMASSDFFEKLFKKLS